jgi:hypothetical protein
VKPCGKAKSYKAKPKRRRAGRESEEPIIVKMIGTTKPYRSEGALL